MSRLWKRCISFFFFFSSLALQSSCLGRHLQKEGANETQKFPKTTPHKKPSSTVAVRLVDESQCHRGSAWRVYLYGWKQSAGPSDRSEGELRVNSCRPLMCFFHDKGVHLLLPSGLEESSGRKTTSPKQTCTLFYLFSFFYLSSANTDFPVSTVTGDCGDTVSWPVKTLARWGHFFVLGKRGKWSPSIPSVIISFCLHLFQIV